MLVTMPGTEYLQRSHPHPPSILFSFCFRPQMATFLPVAILFGVSLIFLAGAPRALGRIYAWKNWGMGLSDIWWACGKLAQSRLRCRNCVLI